MPFFRRVFALVPPEECARRSHRLRPQQRESERTTDSRHPQRLSGGVVDPIERQFNEGKRRRVDLYPEKYMQLLQDKLYQDWQRSQRERRELGEDISQALSKPWVVGDFSDSLTEENPNITIPLPEIRLLRAMKPKKGR